MSAASTISSRLELSAVVTAALLAIPPQAAPIPTRRQLPARLACPRCQCKATHRSRRRGFDWIMSAIGYLPARCFTCDRRFYARQLPVKTPS